MVKAYLRVSVVFSSFITQRENRHDSPSRYIRPSLRMVTIHPNDQHLKAQKTVIPGITATNFRRLPHKTLVDAWYKRENYSTLILGEKSEIVTQQTRIVKTKSFRSLYSHQATRHFELSPYGTDFEQQFSV